MNNSNKRTMHFYTEEEIKKILELRKSGMLFREIMDQLGVGSLSGIKRICEKEYGINPCRKYSRREDLLIVKMRARNYKWREIGATLNRTTIAVEARYKYLKSRGELEKLEAEARNAMAVETDDTKQEPMEPKKRNFTLADFTFDEIFRHLLKRGYDIQNGILVRVIPVDLSGLKK